MKKHLRHLPLGIFLLILLVCIAEPVCAQVETDVYGYFAFRYENVWNEPALDSGGNTYDQSAPGETDIPFVNIMMQSQLDEQFKAFVNLNGGGADTIDVRNVWGEYSGSEQCNIRIGKMYRKFGLYNEILDAVPTYIGIEPPELFDSDHLIVSRTTDLMFHGRYQYEAGTIYYSISTDDGEGSRNNGETLPIGADVNYRFGDDDNVIGLSGYTSGGDTGSDVGVGEGSPKSGVLPWMERDAFKVIGGYFESTAGELVFQAAYWHAEHKAVRDPASVVAVINGASPNTAQLRRFLIDPSGAVAEANVNTNGDYDVDTYYVRAGYSIESEKGEFVPYIQWDWYKNEETIASKGWGGDNEAGVADDGEFSKATIGIVYRPIPKVAVKLDGSSHFYDFNGKSESYPEIRFDVSYIFGL
jgi:hypothetical protein